MIGLCVFLRRILCKTDADGAARRRPAGLSAMKAVVAAALAVALPFASGASAAERVPTLQELRKPVDESKLPKEEEAPVVPKPVSPSSQVIDPARICPDGAVIYVAVPDAARFNRDLVASPMGNFINESALEKTLRNNRFGLGQLFGDLPAAIISAERVSAMAAISDLANVMSRSAERMAMATYIDEAGSISFLFLFDMGLVREDAFRTMGEWETSFFLNNPGAEAVRNNHAGNFLDSWTLKNERGTGRDGEIVAGFVENMFVISNDSAIANASLALLGGGQSLAASSWGQRLAASIPSSSSADAVAFVRMDALLEGLRETPIARNAVAAWADYLGWGGDAGEAIYYGLQFTENGCRETMLLPVAGENGSASLVELLAKRLRPVEQWTTPSIMPYQPTPEMFVGAMMEGRQLASLLRQERRLFGITGARGAFEVPAEIRRIFANGLTSVLTGEIGIAIFPALDETQDAPWLLVAPCSADPTPLLKKTATTVDRNAATIYSEVENWRDGPSWTVVSSSRFRRVTGHYYVAASQGDLLISTLDQLQSGMPFASNKDFSRAIARAERNQGMIFYINLPEILVRQYPHLSSIMRALYPRSSGLNSRPPLSLLRRYTHGMLGVIAPSANGGGFTRVTVQSPIPSMAIMGGGTVMRFPMNLRQDGRIAMLKSADNLKAIWMRLQLYSSRFGHFPESLDDLAAELRTSMADDEIRAMLTAPGALGRLSREDAASQSYHYLSGITPNDEPDIPIVYEAQPWSEDFAGMFPAPGSGRAPSESGDYLQYRQMVLLDGTVRIVPEKEFQDKIVSRLAERE